MWLRITPHYKGKFPVQVNGENFGGFGPRFVDDKTGEATAKMNFPYCVPCDKDGKYLVEVPPVKVVVVANDPIPTVSLQTESAGDTAGDDLSEEDEVQPTIEAVNDFVEGASHPSRKKGKK